MSRDPYVLHCVACQRDVNFDLSLRDMVYGLPVFALSLADARKVCAECEPHIQDVETQAARVLKIAGVVAALEQIGVTAVNADELPEEG